MRVSRVLQLLLQNGTAVIATAKSPPQRGEESDSRSRTKIRLALSTRYIRPSLLMRTHACSYGSFIHATRRIALWHFISNSLPFCNFHQTPWPFSFSSVPPSLYIPGNPFPVTAPFLCCVPLLHRTMKFKTTVYNVQEGYMYTLSCWER